MEITKIGLREFQHAVPAFAQIGTGSRVGPFNLAVAALKKGKGVKVACQWKHAKRANGEYVGTCHGAQTAYLAAKRSNFKVRASCVDGTLYVLRTA